MCRSKSNTIKCLWEKNVQKRAPLSTCLNNYHIPLLFLWQQAFHSTIQSSLQMWAEDTSYKPVCFDYNNINYIIKYYTFELQISVEEIDKKNWVKWSGMTMNSILKTSFHLTCRSPGATFRPCAWCIRPLWASPAACPCVKADSSAGWVW